MNHPFRTFLLLAGLTFCLSAPCLAAKVSIQGYFTSAFTDTAYQNEAVRKVIAAWRGVPDPPPAGNKSVYIIRLNRQGAISFKKLHMSSGSGAFDQEAGDCLDRAAPFAPLPDSFRFPYLEVHFHFEVIP